MEKYLIQTCSITSSLHARSTAGQLIKVIILVGTSEMGSRTGTLYFCCVDQRNSYSDSSSTALTGLMVCMLSTNVLWGCMHPNLVHKISRTAISNILVGRRGKRKGECQENAPFLRALILQTLLTLLFKRSGIQI